MRATVSTHSACSSPSSGASFLHTSTNTQGSPWAHALVVALVYLIQLIAFLPAWLRRSERHFDLTGSITWVTATGLALVATGCAVAAWMPDRLAVESGVAAPLLWMAVARVSTGLDGPVPTLAAAYQDHPWVVTAAAIAALLMGRNR